MFDRFLNRGGSYTLWAGISYHCEIHPICISRFNVFTRFSYADLCWPQVTFGFIENLSISFTHKLDHLTAYHIQEFQILNSSDLKWPLLWKNIWFNCLYARKWIHIYPFTYISYEVTLCALSDAMFHTYSKSFLLSKTGS